MKPVVDAFIQGRAKFKKNEVGHYFTPGKNPKAACHLGAIWWGTHKNTNYEGALAIDYPELLERVPIPCNCDLIPDKEGEIRSILIHLSDNHDGRSGWTNEKVAEWLESSLA